jgi:hypothetical protein
VIVGEIACFRQLRGIRQWTTQNHCATKLEMSAVVKIAVGVVCFFGFGLASLLLMYAVSPWIDRAVIPFFGSRVYDTVLFGVTGALSALTSIRLIQGKMWAWWAALAVSGIILGLGVLLLFTTLHPRDDFARSEAGFGMGISIILTLPGAISTVLLSLPRVRRRFE